MTATPTDKTEAMRMLGNFRRKNPQYNDLADEDLAQRISKKWPVYKKDFAPLVRSAQPRPQKAPARNPDVQAYVERKWREENPVRAGEQAAADNRRVVSSRPAKAPVQPQPPAAPAVDAAENNREAIRPRPIVTSTRLRMQKQREGGYGDIGEWSIDQGTHRLPPKGYVHPDVAKFKTETAEFKRGSRPGSPSEAQIRAEKFIIEDTANLRRVLSDDDILLEQAKSGLSNTPRALRSVHVGLTQAGLSGMSIINRILGRDKDADYLNRLGDALANANVELGSDTAIESWIAGAANSLATMMATRGFGKSKALAEPAKGLFKKAAANLSGQKSVIVAFTAQATNQAITTGRDAGLSGGELVRFAVTQGAIEGLVTTAFSAAGAGGLEGVGLKRAAAGNAIRTQLRLAGYNVLEELPEEIIIQIAQSVNSYVHNVDINALDEDRLALDISNVVGTTLMTMGASNAPPMALNVQSQIAGDRAEQLYQERVQAALISAGVGKESARLASMFVESRRKALADAQQVAEAGEVDEDGVEPEVAAEDVPQEPAVDQRGEGVREGGQVAEAEGAEVEAQAGIEAGGAAPARTAPATTTPETTAPSSARTAPAHVPDAILAAAEALTSGDPKRIADIDWLAGIRTVSTEADELIDAGKLKREDRAQWIRDTLAAHGADPDMPGTDALIPAVTSGISGNLAVQLYTGQITVPDVAHELVEAGLRNQLGDDLNSSQEIQDLRTAIEAIPDLSAHHNTKDNQEWAADFLKDWLLSGESKSPQAKALRAAAKAHLESTTRLGRVAAWAKSIYDELKKGVKQIRDAIAGGSLDVQTQAKAEALAQKALGPHPAGATKADGVQQSDSTASRGDDWMPVGKTTYALQKRKWSPKQDATEFGTVNNRLSKELEIFERLLGPLAGAMNMPGPREQRGSSVRAASVTDLADAIWAAHKDGRLAKLLDKTVSAESLADERGLKGRDRSRFIDEIKGLRSDAPILSDNGKAGKSIDFILATCHPTSPCKDCYAAKSMIRMAAVRKAFRNTVNMLVDPEGFGKRAALEIAKISTTSMPFVRLLGSGDLTSTEMVKAFNVLAKNCDRPLHIFSRHHDMLAKLKSGPNAPFLRMGSVDSDLYTHYGFKYLSENAKKRGIVNCFMYGAESDVAALRKLYDAGALGLTLPTSRKLYEKLPADIRLSSCPCDADERTYFGSCRRCALSQSGCFMNHTVMGVDKTGKPWLINDPAAPSQLTPVTRFFPEHAQSKTAEAMSKTAQGTFAKSIELIKLYVREFSNPENNREVIPLKDLRDPHTVTPATSLAQANRYIADLTRLKVLARNGTFYLPGGEIQPEVAYRDGVKVEGPEAAALKAELALNHTAYQPASDSVELALTQDESKALAATSRKWKTTKVYNTAINNVIKKGDAVLDYGSGKFLIAQPPVEAKGATYTAHDPHQGIKQAKRGSKYDVVMASNVINTVVKLEGEGRQRKHYKYSMNEMTSFVKPGGSLVVNLTEDKGSPRPDWMTRSLVFRNLESRFESVDYKNEVFTATEPKETRTYQIRTAIDSEYQAARDRRDIDKMADLVREAAMSKFGGRFVDYAAPQKYDILAADLAYKHLLLRRLNEWVNETDRDTYIKNLTAKYDDWIALITDTNIDPTDHHRDKAFLAGVPSFGRGVTRQEVMDEAGAAYDKQVEKRDALQAEVSEMEKGISDFTTLPPAEGEPITAKVYHGTSSRLVGNKFDPSKLGNNTQAGSAQLAHFFSGSKETAAAYGGSAKELEIEEAGFADMDVYDRDVLMITLQERFYEEEGDGGDFDTVAFQNWLDDNPEIIKQEAESITDVKYDPTPVAPIRSLYELYVHLKNPMVVDQKGATYRETTYRDYLLQAKKRGHDGLIILNTYDGGPKDHIFALLAGNEHQIKSADVRAKDPTGEVIPPSERFDMTTDVISYNIQPILEPENPSEKEIADELGFGLNKESNETVRAALNFSAVPTRRRPFALAIQEAIERKAEDNALNVAMMVEEEGYQASDVEHVGAIRKTAMLLTQLEDARVVGDLVMKQRILEELELLTRATQHTRTAIAQALSIGQMRLSADTYSVTTILADAAQAKGKNRTLTKSSIKKLGDLAEQHKKQQKELDESMAADRKKSETLSREQADKEIAAAVKKATEQRKRTARIKGRRDKLIAQREDVLNQLRSLGMRVNEAVGVSAEASFLIGKLALIEVELGANTLRDVMDKVKARMPGIEDMDVVHGVNAGNPQYQARVRTELQKQKAIIKRAAKLTEEMAQLARNVVPAPKPRTATEESRETSILRKQIAEAKKRLRLALRLHNAQAGKVPKGKKAAPETKEIKDLRAKIAELEQQNRLKAQIKEAEAGRAKSPRERKEASAVVKELQAKLKELRKIAFKSKYDADRLSKIHERILKIYDQLEGGYRDLKKNPSETPPDIALAMEGLKRLEREMAVEDTLADLTYQLKTGKYKQRPKPVRPVLSRKTEWNLVKIKKLRREIQGAIVQEGPWNFVGGDKSYASEAINTLRSLRATGDVSFTFRQNAVLTFSHPLIAAKMWGKSFIPIFNQDAADRVNAAIEASPNAYWYDVLGLRLSDPSSHQSLKRDEVFQSNFIERNKWVGWGIRGSNRHATTFTNLMRTAAMDRFIDAVPNFTVEEGKAYANFINTVTGAASLGKAEPLSKILSVFIFAPRLAASRFTSFYLAAKYFAKYPRMRKAIAREMVGWVASTMIAMSLLAAFLRMIDDDEVSIQWDDPDDPDWGRLRWGDQRIDLWGGFQPPARLIAKGFMGLANKMGINDAHLSDTQIKQKLDFVDQFAQYTSYKAAPVVSLTRELATGETAVGEDTTVGASLLRSVTPMFAEDVWESIEVERSATKAGATFIFAQGGIGSQTYEDSKSRVRGNMKKAIADGNIGKARTMMWRWNSKNRKDKFSKLPSLPKRKE